MCPNEIVCEAEKWWCFMKACFPNKSQIISPWYSTKFEYPNLFVIGFLQYSNGRAHLPRLKSRIRHSLGHVKWSGWSTTMCGITEPSFLQKFSRSHSLRVLASTYPLLVRILHICPWILDWTEVHLFTSSASFNALCFALWVKIFVFLSYFPSHSHFWRSVYLWIAINSCSSD